MHIDDVHLSLIIPTSPPSAATFSAAVSHKTNSCTSWVAYLKKPLVQTVFSLNLYLFHYALYSKCILFRPTVVSRRRHRAILAVFALEQWRLLRSPSTSTSTLLQIRIWILTLPSAPHLWGCISRTRTRIKVRIRTWT